MRIRGSWRSRLRYVVPAELAGASLIVVPARAGQARSTQDSRRPAPEDRAQGSGPFSMNGGLDRFFAGAKRSPVHTRLQWPRSPGGSHQEPPWHRLPPPSTRSEEHTSELQSLMRISYAVFCLKKKNKKHPLPPMRITSIQTTTNNKKSVTRT